MLPIPAVTCCRAHVMWWSRVRSSPTASRRLQNHSPPETAEVAVSSPRNGWADCAPVARGQVRKASSSFQVRILAPKLGLFKGMLCVKKGIDHIQLPPSMRKVDPSLTAKDDDTRVWVLVRLAHPTKNNQILGKCPPGKSQKQKEKLSPMIKTLLHALKVPPEVMEKYQRPPAEQSCLRKEAWVVGVADPTGKLPDGHIYISGLSAAGAPVLDGKKQVFITRMPCVKPSDGRRLPIVTSRAEDTSEEAWQALEDRPFGEVIFPSNGIALPQSIAAGDIDGDLYCIIWDHEIVTTVQPEPLPESHLGPEQPPQGAADVDVHQPSTLGAHWLEKARAHMLDPKIHRQRFLIGSLFNAAMKKCKQKGMYDDEVQTLFKACSDCIDMGKHGGELNLPPHLLQELKIQL